MRHRLAALLLGPLLFAAVGTGRAAPGTTDLFPSLEGWKAGAVKSFHPHNLFVYLNGAADLYLSYGMTELKVVEYSGASQSPIVVEVYHHPSPALAFGIYSLERPDNPKLLEIGGQGYVEGPALAFISGSAYVKVNGQAEEKEVRGTVEALARGIAARLGPADKLPAPLAWLPSEGRRPGSEKYFIRSFLGHGFLRSAYSADYLVGARALMLFVIEGQDPGEREGMLREYLKFAGIASPPGPEGRAFLQDPYHGPVALAWRGKYLWGIRGVSAEAEHARYLDLVGAQIPK
jgi:hypothetical protein